MNRNFVHIVFFTIALKILPFPRTVYLGGKSSVQPELKSAVASILTYVSFCKSYVTGGEKTCSKRICLNLRAQSDSV